MKRWGKILVVVFTATLLVTGCTLFTGLLNTGLGSWAERSLKHLTLRQKIAQMLVYHMNMKYLNENSSGWQEVESLVKSDGVGGIHIYRGNVGDAILQLNQLQHDSKIPILVDADLEYGVGWRVPGGTDIPYNMAIAATGNPQNAFTAGKITADRKSVV